LGVIVNTDIGDNAVFSYKLAEFAANIKRKTATRSQNTFNTAFQRADEITLAVTVNRTQDERLGHVRKVQQVCRLDITIFSGDLFTYQKKCRTKA